MFKSILVSLLGFFLYCGDARAQVDCDWEPPQLPCTDTAWTGSSLDVWIEMSSTPPCSVMVRSYFKYRCLQIEFQDVAISLIVTIPSGCATGSQIATFVSTASFRTQLANAVILEHTRNYYLQYPSRRPICPSAQTVTYGRVLNCQRMVVIYSFPDGQSVEVDYDSNMPWWYYQSLYVAQGGSLVQIGFSPCQINACCLKTMTHCVNEQGQLIYSFGNWVSNGSCPVTSPCKYHFCE